MVFEVSKTAAEVRRALAERYPGLGGLGVEEAAALLVGFSDARALRRAHRRWTGRSRAEVRRDRRAR